MGFLKIDTVMVEARDPVRLAAFWGEVLGRTPSQPIGPYVFLSREDGLAVGFQRSDSPKVGKNRLHLDVRAADPVAARHRVEALGGRRLPGYDDGGFLVMADPEGNEFCILPETPVDLDDSGRVHYLPDNQD